MKNILILTDFSAAAEKALLQAQRLSELFGSELHLLYKVVYPLPHPPTELLDRLDDAARFDDMLKEVLERPEREARAGLEERATRIRARGLEVRTHLVRSGEVFATVEETLGSVGADLVVMGRHGRSGLDKWLMGSLAEKVLRHAACDVLSLHAASPVAGSGNGLGEILVATDFSNGSRRALETGARMADRGRGSLCLLHVLQELRTAPGEEVTTTSVSDRSRYEILLEEEMGGRAGETVLSEGIVVQEIERIALERGSSMIVTGTHGRTGLRRALIGSVAERVARLSHLPVLTVR